MENFSKYKNVFVGITFVAVVLFLGYLKYSGFNGTNASSTTATSITSIFHTGGNASVDVKEPAPVVGQRKAVIEVGASGFNYFIANVNKGKYSIYNKEKHFGDSFAYVGLTDAAEIKSKLRQFIKDIMSKGVSGNNIHFVVSSGALKNPNTKPIIDSIRASNYVVNEVTAQQEGIMAFYAAMNDDYRNQAFVVDVGSGNTKISWINDEGQVQTLEAPGSLYSTRNTTDDAAYGVTKSLVANVPESKRSVCFVIGGVPNALTKKQGVTSRYTTLQSLSNFSDVSGFKEPDKVKNGLNILKAVQDVTGATFVFDDDANFTLGWLARM